VEEFDMSRLIYARDYAKIKEVYSDHDIPADLGVVIGAITESQKLINHALELDQRGGQINMCNALEELRQEGVEEGRQEGRWEGILEGIRATVRTCRNFNISETDTVRNIMNEFSLSQEEAVNYVKKYW
jgi:predicted transposase YdaD